VKPTSVSLSRLTIPLLALLLVLSLARVATAQALTIGDDAPAIDVETWLHTRDAPVEAFEPGHTYVVEFWATWCGPCLETIPHLDALQRERADDIKVVSITKEPTETVRTFIEETDLATSVTYDIGSDPDGDVFEAWMHAARHDDIPTAFVVGPTGRIEWIGHPLALDDVVDRVVSGDWDPYAVRAWESHVQRMDNQLAAAHHGGAWQRAAELSGRLAAAYESDARPPYYDPDDGIAYETFRARLLLRNAEPERAYSYVRALSLKRWSRASFLNNLGWFIADDPGLDNRDLELALVLAKRANELTDYHTAAHLDTLARVYFERGDLEQALRWQRAAVEALGPRDDPAPIMEAFERYQSASSDAGQLTAPEEETER